MSREPAVVAAIQLCSSNDWMTNAAEIDARLAQAARAGARLAVLPENMAAFGPDAVPTLTPRWRELRDWLAGRARAHGLWLVGGTLPVPERPDGTPVPGRVRSVTWVFSDQGDVVGRYDKCHLFDVEVADAQGSYRESATFEPGEGPVLIPTPWGGLGVLTCYDLRFGEQARLLRAAGAELLVVPAAFTAMTGEAHWQVLLRARAIETQCLVIGAGQGGRHSAQRETWGHSQVIDAWGRVLAEQAESGPGIVTAVWDRDEQAALRRRMPLQSHQRPLPMQPS